MNGLSVMKRTASTSMSILAVSSAITSLSAKPAMVVSSLLARHHLPLDRLAAAIKQRALVRSRDLDLDRRRPRCFLQHDFILVRRQAIMLRAVEAGKGFELVERTFLFQSLGICGERNRRIEDARNTADRDLARERMRGGIGAEEIA